MTEVEFLTLPERDFLNYAAEGSDQSTGTLLVQVDEGGRVQDHFRVSLSGPTIRGQFAASDFSTCPEISELQFVVEASPEDIKPQPNRFVTKWMDLEEHVASGRVAVRAADGSDGAKTFRAACKSKETGPVAAAVH